MNKDKDTLKSNKGFNEVLKAVATHNPKQRAEQSKSLPKNNKNK